MLDWDTKAPFYVHVCVSALLVADWKARQLCQQNFAEAGKRLITVLISRIMSITNKHGFIKDGYEATISHC